MSDDEFDAQAWINAELSGLPGSAMSPENRERTRALWSLRDQIYAGQGAREIVADLDPLCPCNMNAGTTDGPEQECPIHGDGVTFVALCRWRDAVVATVRRYRDLIDQDAPMGVGPVWVRVCDLLDAGPWAGEVTDAAIAGDPLPAPFPNDDDVLPF